MNANIFSSWAAPFLEFFSLVAWPVVAILLALLFRAPIASTIASIEELEGFGIKGRLRRGNHRAETLRNNTSSDQESPENDRNPRGMPPRPGSELESGATGVIEEPHQSRKTWTDRELITFYTLAANDRLRHSKYNTSTTSRKLSSEIVGNSYADLKQALRFFHLITFGDANPNELVSTTQILHNLEFHSALSDDIKAAREFAVDVNSARETVDGRGAEAYIDTVATLIRRAGDELISRFQ